MRLIHFSDTHLGYSAYHKVAENGINQREMDVYTSFKKVVDYAIKEKPDAVIHSGDLFDTVRPSNRALSFALHELLRLSENEIPTIILAGNHETPKLKETGSAFKIFEHLKHIYPIFNGKAEKVTVNNMVIHAIPHCHSTEELKNQISSIALEKGNLINVLALHAGVIGIKDFNYIRGDFNEQVITSSSLSPNFDYIALGHYHRSTQVTSNAFYAGSIEHFSFKEAGEPKGFYDILFNGKTEYRFVPIQCRGMIDILRIDCRGLNPHTLEKDIVKAAETHDINGRIVRITLDNLSRSTFKTISWTTIKKAYSASLHLEINYTFEESEKDITGEQQIGNLADEWKNYINQISFEGNKKDLEELAISYFSEVYM